MREGEKGHGRAREEKIKEVEGGQGWRNNE